eukprot:2443525-Pyramimonas_sp.AAC.2
MIQKQCQEAVTPLDRTGRWYKGINNDGRSRPENTSLPQHRRMSKHPESVLIAAKAASNLRTTIRANRSNRSDAKPSPVRNNTTDQSDAVSVGMFP